MERKKDNRWFLSFRCYKYPDDYNLLDIKGFIAEDLRLCVHTFNTVNKGKKKLLGIHATAKNKYYIYEALAEEGKAVCSLKKASETISEWLKDPEVDTASMTAEYENGYRVRLDINRHN
jgi:hypothetical protein